jgi:anion-transporting  ArsA/GET3 family ATPase
MTLKERLLRRRLLLVTGKGGVGKSAVSAALARLLEGSGRDVFLLEADPRESLFGMLGVEPSGGEVVRVSPRLRLQGVPLDRVVDGLVREMLPIEWISRRVLASPIYRQFNGGLPGLRESCLLGHALNLLEHPTLALGRGGRAPDVVVLDAPASGHVVSLLDAPRLLSEVIEHGPVGILVGRLARFLADAEAAGTVVVTTGEEMPVQETLELVEALDARGGRPELVVANALWPPVPPKIRGKAEGRDELWLRRSETGAREISRLERVWSGPLARIPLLPLEAGPALVSEIRGRLETCALEERTEAVS